MMLGWLWSLTCAATTPLTIDGTVRNTGNFPQVYLYAYFGPQLVRVDSAALTKGKFQLTYEPSVPRGLYRIGVSEARSFPLVLTGENVTFEADLVEPNQPPQFQQSPENQLFAAYQKQLVKFRQAIRRVLLSTQQLSYSAAPAEEKNRQMKAYKASYDSLTRVQSAYHRQLAEAHPRTFVGKMAALYLISPDATREEAVTQAQLQDQEILRSDLLLNLFQIYLQHFAPEGPHRWREEIPFLLSRSPAGSAGREVTWLSLIPIFMNADPDYGRQLVKQYAREFPESAYAQEKLRNLPPGSPVVGDRAPDLLMKGRDGNMIALSSLRGKWVLIDFWASWCSPCRHENPALVRAYRKFQNQGFTVYSISLDKERGRWLQAIEDDQLSWASHVSDLQGWKSGGAALYGINAIPANFLIDPEGEVVAVNLRGAELDQKLEEIFK